MVDLSDDLASGDLTNAMRIFNMLYDTKLLMSAYLKIIDLKVQYCTGRKLLLFCLVGERCRNIFQEGGVHLE